MPLGSIQNLALQQAEADEKKRRAAQADLALESEGLKDELLDLKRDVAAGPVGQLDALTGGKRVAVAPDVLRNVEEHRFLDENRERRLQQRETDLLRRNRDLAVPGPSQAVRAAEMAAPLGRFAYDDPTREDLPELRRLREGADADVPRETPDTSRYFYREEPNGTLAFTNRPEVAAEPGYRRYGSARGKDGMEYPDLGAPGGSIGRIGGGETRERTGITPQGLLDQLITQTERLPLTERETMGALATEKPGYDVEAANLADPAAIEQKILTDVGAGKLDPGVGRELLSRYANVARQATDNGEYRPDLLQEILQPRAMAGPPTPGAAELLARQGGQEIPAQAEAERAAVEDAVQAPPGGPGATQSPSLAAESQDPREGLLAGIRSAARQGTDRFGGAPMPDTPPGLVEGGLRVGGPVVGALAGGAVGFPNVGAGAGGAAGELLAEIFGPDALDPGRIAMAGGGAAAGGKLLGLAGRGLEKGLGAVRTLGGLRPGGALEQGLRGVGGAGRPLRDEAGGLFPGGAARDAARQYGAEVGSTPIPEGAVPYLRENLPALRGAPGPVGGSRVPDEVMTIEELIDAYLRGTRPRLPGPAAAPETLPALRGGGFVLR
jgi:hypothetical protein